MSGGLAAGQMESWRVPSKTGTPALSGTPLRGRAAGRRGPALFCFPPPRGAFPAQGSPAAATRADGSRGLHGNTDVTGLESWNAASRPQRLVLVLQQPGAQGRRSGHPALARPGHQRHAGVNWASQASPAAACPILASSGPSYPQSAPSRLLAKQTLLPVSRTGSPPPWEKAHLNTMWEVRCWPLPPPLHLGPSVHCTIKPGDSVLQKDHVPPFPPLPSASHAGGQRPKGPGLSLLAPYFLLLGHSFQVPGLRGLRRSLPSVWKAVPTSLSPCSAGHFQLLQLSSVLPGPGRCSLLPARPFSSIHCPCENDVWDLCSGWLLRQTVCSGGLCSLLSTREPLVYLAHSRYSINIYIYTHTYLSRLLR